MLAKGVFFFFLECILVEVHCKSVMENTLYALPRQRTWRGIRKANEGEGLITPVHFGLTMEISVDGNCSRNMVFSFAKSHSGNAAVASVAVFSREGSRRHSST